MSSNRMALLTCVVVAATTACVSTPPRPEIAVDVSSNPELASVTFKGEAVGMTPVTLTIRILDDVLAITAQQEQLEPMEKRVRIIDAEHVQVTFVFGDEPTPLAKKLGLARIVVFDFSENVSFDTDQYELKPELMPILTGQADLLNRYFGPLDVFVCGHTDSTGGMDHNLELSLKRAQTVAKVLAKKGVRRSRTKIQGLGPDYPVDTNETPEGRALNRRTEVILPAQ